MLVLIQGRRRWAARVVLEPQLRIAEHPIGARELLHAALGQLALFVGGVEEAIRVPFFGQGVVAMTNLILAGLLRYPQHMVIILLFVLWLQFGHVAPPGLMFPDRKSVV